MFEESEAGAVERCSETFAELEWQEISTCLIAKSGGYARNKIAGFDLDGTLIDTKSKAKFPKDLEDWKWWNQNVKPKIHSLYEEGYKIVIFTNQAGVSVGQTSKEDLMKKIENIIKDLGVPLLLIAALDKDQYRKPSTKMWEICEKQNKNLSINKQDSFMCGDAAGRKKDFSDSDLKFALNVGVKFLTPENIFADSQEYFVKTQGFNPKSYFEQRGNVGLFEGSAEESVDGAEGDFVVFCGSPASGKTTFWANYMPNYDRVCLEECKTRVKCLEQAQKLVKQGKNVVIDLANPTKESRKYCIDLAQKLQLKPRCFYFAMPKQLCFHLNNQRVSNPAVKHFSKKVPLIPIHAWFKNFEIPSLEQGFFEIKTVNFIPKFHGEQDEKYFYMLTS